MAPRDSGDTKRCYYDVLEVDKSCTEDDVKKAFRKQALIWHPGEEWRDGRRRERESRVSSVSFA